MSVRAKISRPHSTRASEVIGWVPHSPLVLPVTGWTQNEREKGREGKNKKERGGKKRERRRGATHT